MALPVLIGEALDKVNLSEKLALFADQWSPRVVGELNGQHVKLVKVSGEFVWHHHEHEDELFLVLHGALEIHLRDRVVARGEGEFFIVPKGVEPASTLNTGNVHSERTVETLERL